MVIVDTSVWSLRLRRQRHALSEQEKRCNYELAEMIAAGQTLIVGPIRQEILTGIKSSNEFEKLRSYLANFEDVPLQIDDYVIAANFANTLLSNGIVGTDIDLIVCAAAFRLSARIFTTDPDFQHYVRHLPILLYAL